MKKRFVAFLLVLIMVLGMLPVSAMAASNSTVVLHPSVNSTVTGVKVKVGDTISGHDITVDLGKYNVNNDTFRLPYAKDIWEGVDNNKVDYISWAGGGSNKRSEGGSALLVNGKNTAYYYFKGATPTKYTYHLIHEFNYVGGTRWDIMATTAAESYQIDVNKGKPTRDRYKFDGWADTANATTASYFGGELITLTKDNPTKTIYAVWKPIFELHYNANGGTGAPDSQTYTALSATSTQATFTVPNQTPTKEGYTFKGWADSATATTAQYQPGGPIAVKHENSPKTVYAVWECNHPKDNDGYCTVPGCNHPDSCCPKKEEPGPSIDPPSEDNLLGLAIAKVYCAMPANHGSKDFFYIKDTLDTSRTYTVNENGFCTVYLHVAPYVAAYNGYYASSPHARRAEDPATVPVTLVYKTDHWEVAKEDDKEVLADIPVYCAETPVEPEKPTALDGSFAIVCKNNEATHAHKAGYIATPSQYTISDVQKDEQGYYVTATVTVEPNLVAYNTLTGAEHRLVNEQDATLTITFRYDTEVTVDENRKWTQQGEVPVVEVICKPKAPTADDLKKLEMAVQVKCVVDASQQHTAAYGLLGECDVDYFVFEPRQEGDDWLCDISYYPERYVAEFNTTFQNLKHVQNDEKIVPVTLIWAGGSWQIKTQGRVHVTEEYTVTYTDGVDGEEVFADQVYSDLRKDSTTPAFNGTPTRTGYTFAGWEPEVAATVTQTVTYVAKWEAKKANVHLMIFKSGDLSKPIVDVPYAADKLAGDTIDLTKIDPSSYLDFDFEIDGGWYDDGMFNSYKRYLDGLQDKPAGLEKLLITGNWQNLKLIVTELVPVVYFDSLESLTAYQNDHSKTEGILRTTKARVGSALPTADAPTATRDGYTFTFWSREGQTTDVTGQTVNGWTNLVANWKVTPHNIYAYARLNSYFAPLTTSEFDTPVTLNAATLSRLGLGSYNSLGYISIGSFTFDAMPLTSDLYFGDDAELSAVAEKLATDIALETGVSDKIAEKIAWTALYKTVNEEDMEPGYPAEAGYQLSGNLNLASVTFRAGAENVENMPAVNYTYDDGAIDFYDFYFAGDTITLPTTEPTREGYSFKGWSVEVIPAENDADCYDADGADDAADETLLKAGDTYTITAGGVIFTAQWEKKTFTVKYYLPDETGAWVEKKMDTVDSVDYATYSLWTPNAEDGYEFSGWYQKPADIGVKAKVEKLYMAKEWKLYGKFTPIEYTIQYVYNDGKATSTNPTTYTVESDTITLADATGADWGKTFLEWHDENGQKITEIPTGSTGDRVITAYWNWPVHLHYLDKDNNEIESATLYVSELEPGACVLPTGEKTGYDFDGWYEAKKDIGTASHKLNALSIAKKWELYGRYTAKTDVSYTVKYLREGDNKVLAPEKVVTDQTFDTEVTEQAADVVGYTPDAPSKTMILDEYNKVLTFSYSANTYDYTVRHIKQLPDGSYDEANAEVETLSGKFEALAAVTAKDYGEHYPTNDADTKQNIKIEEGLTIDVKYDLDEHTLTFETNGGSAINPVTVRHGNAVARPADPTKDKYTFIGWYADPEFTEEYDFATVLEADKTIYAKFELTSTPIGDIYVRYDVLHIKQLPDGSYDLANAEVEHLSAKKDTTVTAVIKDYRATHHVNVNRTLSKLTGTAIQPSCRSTTIWTSIP